MYQATMTTENFLGRRAGYSDRIKGGSGLVARAMTPIEQIEGWDRAELEKALAELSRLRVAEIAERDRIKNRRAELVEKNKHEVHEGARLGRRKTISRLNWEFCDKQRDIGEIRAQEARVHRVLLKINVERYLDLYQKAVSHVVDGQTSALIEKEYLRLKRLAETGA